MISRCAKTTVSSLPRLMAKVDWMAVIGAPSVDSRSSTSTGLLAAVVCSSSRKEISWMVMNGTAECTINGTSVGKWTAAELVGEGKLKSLDGVYGIRVAHNIDVKVSGLSMMKH